MLKAVHLILKWLIYCWCVLFLYNIFTLFSAKGDGVPGLLFYGFLFYIIPLILVCSIRSYIGTILKKQNGIVVVEPGNSVNFAYLLIILLASGFIIYTMFGT